MSQAEDEAKIKEIIKFLEERYKIYCSIPASELSKTLPDENELKVMTEVAINLLNLWHFQKTMNRSAQRPSTLKNIFQKPRL